MLVSLEENEKYRLFVNDLANRIGVFDFAPDQVVWHYTDGAGILGILQSSTLYATQVSSLNDPNETKYATDLYKEVVKQVIAESSDDHDAVAFYNAVLEAVKENPESPTHGISKFFVTSFSADENDLAQWRLYGGKNPYAIGFYAGMLNREPNSQLYKVVYERDRQHAFVREIVDATLRFYREGLVGERLSDPAGWAKAFYSAWDEWIYKLAPIAKDECWRTENEFRIVHELKAAEFAQVRFSQKNTVLARYLPLSTPMVVKRRAPLLPIAKIWIGPGERQVFTRISINLLLEQMGYMNIPVEISNLQIARP